MPTFLTGSDLTADALPADAETDAAAAIRILVVDDSRLQRRILMSALAPSGFALDEAGSGEEALDKCRATPPDIVISDWMMPGMTGLELCHAVREEAGEEYVYFIILTSKSEKGDLAQALKIGADDFLSKPFSADELMGRIAAGERLLRMGHELREKNRLISTTLKRMREMNAALDRDLIEARKLQMSLSPSVPVERDPWTVSFALQPSGHIGGDLIGSFPSGPDRLGIYCFDVSGHGIASALIGARLASWMSDSAADQNVAMTTVDGTARMLKPPAICARLNARFLEEINSGHYFTAIIGELDLLSGLFTFAQAGHPYPVLQDGAGRQTLIGQGGPPIGLLPDAKFDEYSTIIPAGGRLLLYSDGVTECAGPDGRMLEEDGLIDFLTRHRNAKGDALLSILRWELSARVDDAEMPDDVSATLIERAV